MSEGLRPLDPDEVSEAAARGAVLLDFRDLGPYCEARIPGAIFIAFSARSIPKHVPAVAPAPSRVVLIGEEDRVRQAGGWLESGGGYDVLGRLAGGMAAWAAAGKPVEPLGRISVGALHERWSENRAAFELVDVREPFEWGLGVIEGARLVSLGDLLGRIGEFSKDRDLVFICEQGLRSATAAALFAGRGYARASSVAEGFGAWFKAGHPVVE